MEFNSTGGMKSPFSPRVRQSITGRRPIGLASAKKNQSKFMQPTEQPAGDVIYKTPTLTIETYGMPLPVMVTETLTFASGDISVRMSPCGWCWVVAGRKVLAWPREAASSTPAAPSAARELTLPQTDLAHKADLVMVFYEEGAQMPSCIGVSPEGVVRYWPSVGTEGAYSDVSCELAGQECDRLTEAKDGLLLATTTCTLVKITTSKEGRPTVICQTLRPPSGWLGGIGRRVSLLFFGSMPAHADTKLVGVVVLPSAPNPENPEEEEECIALVAGGPLLQMWCGADVYEHNLRRPLSEAFARAHLAPQGDLNSLEMVALDVHAAGPRALLLLVAAVNVARAPDMRYAIAQISISRTDARVISLCALRVPRDDCAPRCLPLPVRPLLYAPAYLCTPAPASAAPSPAADACECVDVNAADDRVLGAALCAGVPLIFTRKHGVLRLRHATDDAEQHAPSICDSPMGSPCPSDMYDGNLSLYEIDPHEVSAMSTEAIGKLQSAFLFHVRGAGAAAARALSELFPGAGAPDAALDRTVLAVAARMLDDAPAGDPRWRMRSPGVGVALGSSAALQASAQLRDKQRAFALFLEFLRAHGLWRRLSAVTDGGEDGEGEGEPVGTQWAMCALAERLAAARALQRLHQAGAPLVDAAFHQVASDADGDEDEEVAAALRGGALSAADVCLRRVTRAPRLLRALAALPAVPPAPPVSSLHACTALTTVLQEMHKCRAQWSQWAGAHRPAPALGPRSTLTALAHAHTRVLQCARRCSDLSLRAQLVEAAAALADLLLADARNSPLYEEMRTDIIRPYFEEGQIERAAVLAEKFKDFDLLIEMCVERNDMERLYGYIDKYADEGIAEKAFAWMSSRGHSALLLRTLAARGARESARARAWFAATPARLHLLALHALGGAGGEGRAGDAGALYAQLAMEADTVARVTTLASIAKLCLAVNEGDEGGDEWRKAETRLALAEQQLALPRDIKLQHGLDQADTKLVEAEDLVQMYIDSDSRCLTEYDYKKALDLTDFVQDMEKRDDLRLRVWCASIRRDEWSQARVDAPTDALRDFIFFRLIDLVHIMGGDVELLLPPLDDILTARELADLVSDARFRFLLQYGYQCVVAPQDDIDDQ